MIFELLWRYWDPHQMGEVSRVLPTSRKTPGQSEPKVDDADSHWPHHQPIGRMSLSWLHPLWTITVKLLTTPPSEDTVLQALALCGPFASQSNKAILFYFTQNSMSPRFNLVLGAGAGFGCRQKGQVLHVFYSLSILFQLSRIGSAPYIFVLRNRRKYNSWTNSVSWTEF